AFARARALLHGNPERRFLRRLARLLRRGLALLRPSLRRLALTLHRSRRFNAACAADRGRSARARGPEYRLEHRDAVLFVAAGDCQRTLLAHRVREMLELGALGARLRKSDDLRSTMVVQVFGIDVADFHLPGREVLDVAYF